MPAAPPATRSEAVTQIRPRAMSARLLTASAMTACLLLAPAIGPAGVARADDSAAASVTVAGLFTPTLVRPGYNAASGIPYATTLGIVADPASRSLITVDQGAPAYVAAYDEQTMRPLAGSGRMLDGAVTALLADARVPGVTVALASAPHQAATAIEHIEVVKGRAVVTPRVPQRDLVTA